MASERRFGHIEGYRVGTLFANRAELAAAGVHRPVQAGISGGQEEGADSIVVSGADEIVVDIITRYQEATWRVLRFGWLEW